MSPTIGHAAVLPSDYEDPVVPKGPNWRPTYSTRDEIAFYELLAAKRKWRQLEFHLRNLNRRSWDGPGMEVNTSVLRERLEQLLRGRR